MDEEKKNNVIIEWFKKNHFNIIFALIFFVGGYLLWANTKPQEPKSIQELINIIHENTKKQVILDPATVQTPKIDDFLKNYTVIKKDDFENIIKAVALVSRQEVVEDYHKSFSILVAMLTIFGIGFPLTVAFVQHRFNERDLDKIEKTATQTETALKQVTEISKQADDAIIKADNATKQADDAIIKADNATKNANEALTKGNNSLKENEKIRDSIWDTQVNVHTEVGKIYDSLSNPYTNDRQNLKIIYQIKADLHAINGLYLILKNSIIDNDGLIISDDENIINANVKRWNNLVHLKSTKTSFIDIVNEINYDDKNIEDVLKMINDDLNNLEKIIKDTINLFPKVTKQQENMTKLLQVVQKAINTLKK